MPLIKDRQFRGEGAKFKESLAQIGKPHGIVAICQANDVDPGMQLFPGNSQELFPLIELKVLFPINLHLKLFIKNLKPLTEAQVPENAKMTG